MPINITINNITGASPYDVYLCDNGTPPFCVYISTITPPLPYNFIVPEILSTMSSFKLKIVDDDGCETIQLLNLP